MNTIHDNSMNSLESQKGPESTQEYKNPIAEAEHLQDDARKKMEHMREHVQKSGGTLELPDLTKEIFDESQKKIAPLFEKLSLEDHLPTLSS